MWHVLVWASTVARNTLKPIIIYGLRSNAKGHTFKYWIVLAFLTTAQCSDISRHRLSADDKSSRIHPTQQSSRPKPKMNKKEEEIGLLKNNCVEVLFTCSQFHHRKNIFHVAYKPNKHNGKFSIDCANVQPAREYLLCIFSLGNSRIDI